MRSRSSSILTFDFWHCITNNLSVFLGCLESSALLQHLAQENHDAQFPSSEHLRCLFSATLALLSTGCNPERVLYILRGSCETVSKRTAFQKQGADFNIPSARHMWRWSVTSTTTIHWWTISSSKPTPTARRTSTTTTASATRHARQVSPLRHHLLRNQCLYSLLYSLMVLERVIP